MALVPVISADDATNPDLIIISDDTGSYNASTNPGGFGAPNPTRGDITVNNFSVTFPNETTPETLDIVGAPYEFMSVNTTLYFTPAFFNGVAVGNFVADATNATPIVIETDAAHGLATGEKVAVVNVGGNLAANGYWTITVLTTTTFSLDGSVGSGAFSSGGSVIEDAAATAFVDGVYLFSSTITASGTDYTANYYHLHTALVECCLSKYANRVNFSDCNSSSFKKFSEMQMQLILAQQAFDCGEYVRAQEMIDRLTKLCNDCGCGCGGC